MAKRKLSSITTWQGVNERLCELSEKKIELSRAEGKQTIEINNIREKYNDITDGLIKEISEIEKDIERFCEQNKLEFLKERTKRFSFGTISYRLSSSIRIKNTAATVEALKELGRNDCLKVSWTPNKERMKELDSGILLKIGASIEEVDKISIEPILDPIGGNLEAENE